MCGHELLFPSMTEIFAQNKPEEKKTEQSRPKVFISGIILLCSDSVISRSEDGSLAGASRENSRPTTRSTDRTATDGWCIFWLPCQHANVTGQEGMVRTVSPMLNFAAQTAALGPAGNKIICVFSLSEKFWQIFFASGIFTDLIPKEWSSDKDTLPTISISSFQDQVCNFVLEFLIDLKLCTGKTLNFKPCRATILPLSFSLSCCNNLGNWPGFWRVLWKNYSFAGQGKFFWSKLETFFLLFRIQYQIMQTEIWCINISLGEIRSPCPIFCFHIFCCEEGVLQSIAGVGVDARRDPLRHRHVQGLRRTARRRQRRLHWHFYARWERCRTRTHPVPAMHWNSERLALRRHTVEQSKNVSFHILSVSQTHVQMWAEHRILDLVGMHEVLLHRNTCLLSCMVFSHLQKRCCHVSRQCGNWVGLRREVGVLSSSEITARSKAWFAGIGTPRVFSGCESSKRWRYK